jgi:hypothetical protein
MHALFKNASKLAVAVSNSAVVTEIEEVISDEGRVGKKSE